MDLSKNPFTWIYYSILIQESRFDPIATTYKEMLKRKKEFQDLTKANKIM